MLSEAINHLKKQVVKKLHEKQKNANINSYEIRLLNESIRLLTIAESSCSDLEHDRKQIYATLSRALILADEAGLYEKEK